jgi:hypothetical protein
VPPDPQQLRIGKTIRAICAGESRPPLSRRLAVFLGCTPETGPIAVFGPVADPEGGYGIAIAGADGETEVGELIAGNPVITDGTGFRYDVYPMPGAISTLQGP